MHVPLCVIVWSTCMCLYVYVETVVFLLFRMLFLFLVLITRSYCIDLAATSCCVDLVVFLFSGNHLHPPTYLP